MRKEYRKVTANNAKTGESEKRKTVIYLAEKVSELEEVAKKNGVDLLAIVNRQMVVSVQNRKRVQLKAELGWITRKEGEKETASLEALPEF